MKCTTVLHGGECHRTSTPHKSGNKMKEKKKKLIKYDKDSILFPTCVRPGGATWNCALLDIKMDTISIRRGYPTRTATTQGDGNNSVDVSQ